MQSETSQASTATMDNWNEIRTKIKERFQKISDEGVDSLKKSLNALSTKIQDAYGYSKEKAESETAAFKASIDAIGSANKTSHKHPDKNL